MVENKLGLKTRAVMVELDCLSFKVFGFSGDL